MKPEKQEKLLLETEISLLGKAKQTLDNFVESAAVLLEEQGGSEVSQTEEYRVLLKTLQRSGIRISSELTDLQHLLGSLVKKYPV